jgi:predicted naringenin-chalcone synthase
MKAHIGAVATAAPAFALGQVEAGEHLLRRFAHQLRPRSVALSRKLSAHPSIRKRHFAIDSPEAFFGEDQDQRIRRFTERSIQLSAEATLKALEGAGLGREDVAALVVNTCTGYICPGISTYLIEALGLGRDTKAYDLVGSGCGGAVPNLELAASLTTSREGRVAVSVSVEICSATMQVGDDLSLLVSNTLFGDGAAAAVLWGRAVGLELVASTSWYVPEDRESIRYVHKNGQLFNQLSTDLPHLVKKAVRVAVERLLEPRGLGVADVPHWAMHTGGDKIVREIAAEIGLSEDQLRPTRRILAEYGNMSSPTVWFVLADLIERGMERGDWCLMVAFGAGLCAHACLLRKA